MKRLLTCLACFLLLSACGGGKRSSKIACDKDYWDGTYGTCLPKGWSVVDRETLRQRGVPEDVIVAFQADESVSGMFPTITLTRERLAQVTDPAAYSEANIRSIGVLSGYESLDTRDVTIDDQRVSLHVFTAQPMSGEPLRRFYQVSTVADSVGYTVTGTTPVSIDDKKEAEILLILKKTTFLEPVEEE